MWCSSVGAKHWKSWLVAFDDTLLGSEKLGTLSLAYGVFLLCFCFRFPRSAYKLQSCIVVMCDVDPLPPFPRHRFSVTVGQRSR